MDNCIIKHQNTFKQSGEFSPIGCSTVVGFCVCFFYFLFFGRCTQPTPFPNPSSLAPSTFHLPAFQPSRSRCFSNPTTTKVQFRTFETPSSFGPLVLGPGSTQLCCVGCGSLALVRMPDWGSMGLEKATLAEGGEVGSGDVEVWMWCGCGVGVSV